MENSFTRQSYIESVNQSQNEMIRKIKFYIIAKMARLESFLLHTQILCICYTYQMTP